MPRATARPTTWRRRRMPRGPSSCATRRSAMRRTWPVSSAPSGRSRSPKLSASPVPASPLSTLVGERDSYPACQGEAARLRAAGAQGAASSLGGAARRLGERLAGERRAGAGTAAQRAHDRALRAAIRPRRMGGRRCGPSACGSAAARALFRPAEWVGPSYRARRCFASRSAASARDVTSSSVSSGASAASPTVMPAPTSFSSD